ncbi:cell cycle control protein 50C-like isoform 2-T2 [Pholidichthys leucotaenia]
MRRLSFVLIQPSRFLTLKYGWKETSISQREDTGDEKTAKPKRKRRKKKTITDVLATSEPKPGSPADLQDLVTQFFSDKRSVIEQEELKLQNSSFLPSNDMTHSLSSYLKQAAPKWAKTRKQHTEKGSVVLLIVCSSALRTIDLIKQLTTFKGEAKVVKLFAKHIKIKEQVTLLQKGITHIGVGTPGRIGALIEKEGLSLRALRYVVLDWNWRDQKLRRMVDIPEVDYTEADTCDVCYEKRKNVTNAAQSCTCKVEFSIKKPFEGDVFFYYGLRNFHQNLRRYMDSRDDAQMVGRRANLKKPASYCEPFRLDANGVPLAPCGAVANSMFNDSFTLWYHSSAGSAIEVPLIRKGLTWYTDKNIKYRNPRMDNMTLVQVFNGTAPPPYWHKPVYELDPNEASNNGFINDDLIVWMREAAFPNFKKLYGILNRSTKTFTNGLQEGNYSIKISYNFPVQPFQGRKEVVLTTLTWFGGQNHFLPIAYLVTSSLILLLSIVLTVVWWKFGKNGSNMEE